MKPDPDIDELIERSSLGTPGAKALRARVSDEEVAKVRALMASRVDDQLVEEDMTKRDQK